MSQLNDDELKKLVESNARAIEAVANTMAENERKSEAERGRTRQEMAELRENLANVAQNLGNAVSFVAKVQGETTADMYRVINKMENRQGEIVEVLKLLTEKVTNKKSEE
jgi:DNA-binding ferritin-like protein